MKRKFLITFALVGILITTLLGTLGKPAAPENTSGVAGLYNGLRYMVMAGESLKYYLGDSRLVTITMETDGSMDFTESDFTPSKEAQEVFVQKCSAVIPSGVIIEGAGASDNTSPNITVVVTVTAFEYEGVTYTCDREHTDMDTTTGIIIFGHTVEVNNRHVTALSASADGHIMVTADPHETYDIILTESGDPIVTATENISCARMSIPVYGCFMQNDGSIVIMNGP